MVEHKLKTWPRYFDAIKRGEKTFEVRLNDRAFQKGDMLVLQRTRENKVASPVEWETHPEHGYALDNARHEIRKLVTYVFQGGQLGIEPGYCVMGLSDVCASPSPKREG